MKKVVGGVIIGVVAVALIAVVAVLGKQYYQDRYSSSDYYAIIPANYDVTPETILSDNGEDLGLGKKYELTAYNSAGEAKDVSFTVFAPGGKMDGQELPQPGQYLLIKASNTIVTGWTTTNQTDIPQGALDKISTGQ